MGDYPPEVDLRREYTEDEYFEHFKKAPLSFAPGEKWDYSNAGYATLGFLIRKVTGKFYGEFLQERIFKPLGMTTARVISEAVGLLIPERNQRIHARCPARRQIAGHHRHREHQQRRKDQ
jgi:CubicO group peptidase (beta-lactamase class C family)